MYSVIRTESGFKPVMVLPASNGSRLLKPIKDNEVAQSVITVWKKELSKPLQDDKPKAPATSPTLLPLYVSSPARTFAPPEKPKEQKCNVPVEVKKAEPKKVDHRALRRKANKAKAQEVRWSRPSRLSWLNEQERPVATSTIVIDAVASDEAWKKFQDPNKVKRHHK